MSSLYVTFYENPDGVYRTGQHISGQVFLRTTKRKLIRGIYLEIKGWGKVRWTEDKTRETDEGETEQYTVAYTGNQLYLSSKCDLVGSSTGPVFQYQPCTLVHDFHADLPQLPSSLEEEYGNIRYKVVVTIDRPYEYNNVFKKFFTVVENINLDDSLNTVPINVEDLKTFSRVFFRDYFIRTSCQIPMSGYFPGQKIPYHVRIENSARKECSRSEMKLEKVVKFTAICPEIKSRTERTKIFEKEFEPLGKLSNKDYKDFIELPSLPPTLTRPFYAINVNYLITVRAFFSGYTSELCFPIKIGTAPLPEIAINPPSTDTVQSTLPIAPRVVTVPLRSTNLRSVDTIQSTAPEISDPPPAYVVQNPPSYEDALALSENVLSDDEDDLHVKKESFVPKYPVYHNIGNPGALDMNLSSNPPAYPYTGGQGTSAKPD